MPINEILSQDQKQKRVWKRIQYLVFISVLLIVAFLFSLEFRHGDMAKHQDWLQQYSEKLIDHYEPVILSSLQTKDNELLDLTLTNLNQQSEVIDAILFDVSGRQISNQLFIPATQLLIHYSASSPQIFVRELRAKDTQLGYLRVTIDRELLLKQNVSISQTKWHLLLTFSVVSLFVGAFIGYKIASYKQTLYKARGSKR